MAEVSKTLQLATLPDAPGVYQFYDKQEKLLYIGKAKNLKKRVRSYFNKEHDNARTRIMVKKIEHIKHIVVDTETDALLLENNLIKKYQPRYNVLLKDDKTYPWICVKKEPFPRVFTTRKIIEDTIWILAWSTAVGLTTDRDTSGFLGPATPVYGSAPAGDIVQLVTIVPTATPFAPPPIVQLEARGIKAAEGIALEHHNAAGRIWEENSGPPRHRSPRQRRSRAGRPSRRPPSACRAPRCPSARSWSRTACTIWINDF